MFDTLTTKALEKEITQVAARLAADTCRWLLLVAEFERREGHLEFGFHCTAAWLSWRCSVGSRSAQEQLRVARRLVKLPRVREAFSRGELSYSKVRAIARVKEDGIEEELLELAQHASAAQLERVVSAYRGAQSLASAQAAHERRHFDYCWEDDGSLSFRGRLAPEEGALLLKAIEAERDALHDERRHQTTETIESGSAEPRGEGESGPAEPPPGPFPRITNADAVVAVAESALAAEGASRSGGDRHEVVVHVDAQVLAAQGDPATEGAADGTLAADAEPSAEGDDPATEPGGRCELERGPAICAETARRLACDGSIVAMRENSRGGKLDVGRKTRAISPATRRALRDRDGGCRFPGCQSHRFVDGHHIHHWAHGGETKLDNLVQLCRRHHRLVHEGGFGVERAADGRFVFRSPDGGLLPAAPRLGPVSQAGAPEHEAHHRRRFYPSPVNGAIPIPLSSGTRLDLGLTVAGLMERATPREPVGPAP